ncbi:beta-amyrin 11-oxidase-like [Lotus japonicus]|uniref:beta-amyrin 11-oxidase-like n=1 Tax=Lotus japonicus TaxID=34305 RepID=UPI00258423BD|nr:beta-amyrin 11-oxidase-like [Lotus japonicus]
MELHWAWVSTATLATCYVFVAIFLRRLNGWYYDYDVKLTKKQLPLPPGDMGWPLIGNLISFIKDFSSGHPDSFINNLHLKYGRTGIYKNHLFGNPSIIICEPEMCRKVLTDDENFKLGYPKSIKELARCRPMTDVSRAEHRHFRRLITAPIIGHKALAMYLERIEDIVTNSLEELSSMKHPVELLKEMKKVSFKAIVHIFMGSSNNQHVIENIGTSFTDLYNGMFSIPFEVPGFAFHKALKARAKLAKIVQPVVDERRLMARNGAEGNNKDLIDILLEVNDEENGQKLKDEDIIDILIGFLFAGHESSATALMWSIVYLTQHPDILKKAKEEQEEIMKTRVPSQNRLSLNEIKQMVYLSHVIDETLRCANIAFSTFREAINDMNINGYIIPKGWRVLIWARAIHMDPKYYPNPDEFNPSRWDDYNAKAGTFLPLGAGSRLCPGSDLAKLEISVFLHYFLLNYKLELINPECPVTCLPSSKPIDNCLAKVIKVSSN